MKPRLGATLGIAALPRLEAGLHGRLSVSDIKVDGRRIAHGRRRFGLSVCSTAGRRRRFCCCFIVMLRLLFASGFCEAGVTGFDFALRLRFASARRRGTGLRSGSHVIALWFGEGCACHLIDRGSDSLRLPTVDDHIAIVRVDLDKSRLAASLLRRHQRRSGPTERIKYEVTRTGGVLDGVADKSQRFHGRMHREKLATLRALRRDAG